MCLKKLAIEMVAGAMENNRSGKGRGAEDCLLLLWNDWGGLALMR